MLKDFSYSILDVKSKLNIKNEKINAFITKKSKEDSCKRILEKSLMFYGFDSENVASCEQIHSNHVKFITEPGVYKKTDGIICTFDSNLVLLIQTADCVPIFIADNSQGLIGLVHSGWKGTYHNIIKNALSIFFNKGSKKSNIMIYLGPSIKECCYQIKEDVSQYFSNKYIIVKNNSLYLNLSKKIKDDIISMGIHTNNIYISEECTFDNRKYYSYRRKDQGRI